MARPLKPTTERKSVDLRIPVTSDQKDAVMQAARAMGIDMAAWARPILLREAQAIVEKHAASRGQR